MNRMIGPKKGDMVVLVANRSRHWQTIGSVHKITSVSPSLSVIIHVGTNIYHIMKYDYELIHQKLEDNYELV